MILANENTVDRLPDDAPSKFLEGIAEISRAVMERNFIDDILSLIVTVTAKVTGSKVCSLLLLDTKKNELALRASQSPPGSYTRKSNTPLGKGIAGRAVSYTHLTLPTIYSV